MIKLEDGDYFEGPFSDSYLDLIKNATGQDPQKIINYGIVPGLIEPIIFVEEGNLRWGEGDPKHQALWNPYLRHRITLSELKGGLTMMYLDWPEFKLISEFYGDRIARRSKVPLINHIKEGLKVMEKMCFSESAMRAFCLHPLFQNDDDLKETSQDIPESVSPFVIVLTMEYRRVANSCLPKHGSYTGPGKDDYGFPKPAESPLPEVYHMLLADKIQNRKDFYIHLMEVIPNSSLLKGYFHYWLTEFFSLSPDQIEDLTNLITQEESEHSWDEYWG